MPENVKGRPLGVFEHPFFCKIGKNEGGPFGDIIKTCEKKYHKAEKNLHKKFLVKVGLEPRFFCLADLKKAVTSMPNPVEVTSVAVSGS